MRLLSSNLGSRAPSPGSMRCSSRSTTSSQGKSAWRDWDSAPGERERPSCRQASSPHPHSSQLSRQPQQQRRRRHWFRCWRVRRMRMRDVALGRLLWPCEQRISTMAASSHAGPTRSEAPRGPTLRGAQRARRTRAAIVAHRPADQHKTYCPPSRASRRSFASLARALLGYLDSLSAAQLRASMLAGADGELLYPT